LSAEDVTITDGERIAQLVFCKVEKVNLIQVQELGSSERGEGGFGSTGVK
jgi:dUTP pyrophosphatase